MVVHSKYIGSFTHFWSLAVEEQFYIFWVFVAVFVPRKHLKNTIITFIVISLLTVFYLMQFTKYWLSDLLVISQMHALGFGALIAYYFKYEPEAFEKLNVSKLKGILVIGLVLYALVFVYRKPDSLYESVKFFKSPSMSVIYLFAVLIAVKDGFTGLIKKVLESRVMIYIGKISYGLYVYHLFIDQLFFNIINKYLRINTNDVGHILIFVALNMIVATISWYLVEKPINGLKRYFKY